MRIQLSGLPRGPQTFTHECSALEYLDNRERFPENIQISATIGREGNALRLNLEIELAGHFICDRCGREFNRLHHAQGEYFFALEEEGFPADPELAIIPKGAIFLDVSQEIRDTVILGMPSKILCRESCQGICPQCGADLNEEACSCQSEIIDPRWEALKKLKE